MSDTEKVTRIATRAREQPVNEDSLIERIVEATERRMSERSLRPNPLELTSFDEVVSFAERAARAGDFIPKDYRNKPDSIILAILKGKELGLPTIQALESIAIVNGRSTVWGDAVPGLCWASGKVQNIEEYFEGTEGTDDYTAVCVATRKGASPKTAKFSVRDAKTAGLYGQATHGKYPKRMMQWRARHFACHDAFPDVLRGIGTRELEVEDSVGPPAWTMPKPEQGWFAKKATAQDDGWDNTWFEGFANKLMNEPNAWKWVGVLGAGLLDAPTLRDVLETEDLPVVQKTIEAAPEEARNTIASAFEVAKARLAKPVTETVVTKATTETRAAGNLPEASQAASSSEGAVPPVPSGDAFDEWLLDEAGEPVEEYSSPVVWSNAFIGLYANSGNRLGLIEQNADGIATAKAASPSATAILDACIQPEQEEQPGPIDEPDEDAIPVIDVPVIRGVEDWKGYITEFKAALAKAGAAVLTDFIAAQYPRLSRAPGSTRQLIVKQCVMRSKELGVDPPAVLSEAVTGKTTTDDPEARVLESIRRSVADCADANTLLEFWAGAAVKNASARLQAASRLDILEQIKKMFEDRHQALAGKPGVFQFSRVA